MARDSIDIIVNFLDQKAQSAMKNMIGSVAKLAGAFLSVRAVVDFGKKSIEEYSKAQAGIHKLAMTVTNAGKNAGYTTEEFIKMAGSLQKVTTFADDDIIAAEAMIVSWGKVSREAFPRVLEAGMDLATFMKVDLNTAMKLIGKVVQDPIKGFGALGKAGILLGKDKEELIKKLIKENKTFEAQDILLKEIEKRFGGLAKGEADTFEGKIKQLANSFDDLKENVGGMLTALGGPVVDFIRNIIDGINEFIQSKEGWEKITEVVSVLAGAFQVLYDVGKFLIDNVFKALESAFKPLIDALGDLTKGATENSPALVLFGRILEAIGFIIRFVGQTTGMSIKLVINFIKVLSAGADMVDKFFKYMQNRNLANAKALGESAANAMLSLKTLGDDFIKGINDIYADAAETGGRMLENALTKDMTGAVVGAYKKTKKKMEETRNEMNTGYTGVTQEEAMRRAAAGNQEGPAATAESEAEKFQKAWTDAISKVQEAFGAWSSFAGQVMGQITGIVDQYYANQETAIENEYKARADAINANVQDEEERNKQLEALEKEKDEKLKKLQHDQFEADRIAKIAQIAMSTAQAVMQALSSIPFPLSLVAAGIVGGLGVAQAALVGSQQNPYQRGADFVVPPGFERDNFAMSARSGEHVQITPNGASENNDRLSGPIKIVVDGSELNAHIQRQFNNRQLTLRQANVLG